MIDEPKRPESTDKAWVGLSDFLSSMALWRRVQDHLAPDVGRRGKDLLLFGEPHLDGNRIRNPNGPAYERTGEGYRDYSIRQDAAGFSIRYSGHDRGTQFDDKIDSRFGNLDFATKFFLYDSVLITTHSILDFDSAKALSTELDQRGLPAGWVLKETEGPAAAARDVYIDAENPEDFYSTYNGDTRTSHIVTRTFRHINELYAAELGLDRLGIPIPDTTT